MAKGALGKQKKVASYKQNLTKHIVLPRKKKLYFTNVLQNFGLKIWWTIVFLGMYSGFSQGTSCRSIEPFCADAGSNSISFRNTSNGSLAENGPNYGCLRDQPNPAWYFLQIDNGGDLRLTIRQNTQSDGTGTGLDVDYIIWGPFNSVDSCTPTDLSGTNIQDCSFLPDPVERVFVPNTQAGEIYVLMITNFEGDPGFISLENNSDGTTTDCSIVAGSLGPDLFPCEGEDIVLDGTTNMAIQYRWFLNGTLINGENDPTLDVSQSGTYTVEVMDANGDSDTDEVEVTFIQVPTPNKPMDRAICTQDGTATFDLTTSMEEALNGIPADDLVITFHDSQENADSGTRPLPNMFTTSQENQRVFVRLESLFNADCTDASVFFDLTVNTLMIPGTNDLFLCDDDLDGDGTNGLLQNIDLALKGDEITNGDPNLDILFFNTVENAETVTNPIASPYSNTNRTEEIYFRMENVSTGCFVISSFGLTVQEAVQLTTTELVQCDGLDGTLDGLSSFNLTEVNDAILITGDSADFDFSYFLSEADAQDENNAQNPIPFQNTIPNQTVYIRVQNRNTQCFDITPIMLGTSTTSIDEVSLSACSEDGFSTFDLSGASAVILQTAAPVDPNFEFYETMADAQLEQNSVDLNYTNTSSGFQQLFVRVEDGNSCFGIGTVDLVVNTPPQFNLGDDRTICFTAAGFLQEEVVLNTGLSPTDFAFTWFLDGQELIGGNMEDLFITTEGFYEVLVTNSATGCQTRDSITLTGSSPPSNLTITFDSAVFSGNQQITIMVTGNGIYNYILDGTVTQDNGVFRNVDPGQHTATVCDVNGCGCVTENFFLLDFPRFFTPNGDTFNDTWNIPTNEVITQANITIFDRYGKLLKFMSAGDSGWDGTFNGRNLPSGDYWFSMDFLENGQPQNIRGHFSLKR